MFGWGYSDTLAPENTVTIQAFVLIPNMALFNAKKI